jgi:hypothetical protein
MATDSVSGEPEMAQDDVAMEALVALSETAQSSIDGLTNMQERLEGARRRRVRGWSWRRIVASSEMGGLFPTLARISGNLAKAGGQFRRATARALRDEGAPTREVADSMQVTRQRVSALARPRQRV